MTENQKRRQEIKNQISKLTAELNSLNQPSSGDSLPHDVYQNLFFNSPSPILIINSDGFVVAANNASGNIMGIPAEKLEHTEFITLLEENHRQPIEYYFNNSSLHQNYMDDIVIIKNNKEHVLKNTSFALSSFSGQNFLILILGNENLLTDSYMESLNHDIHFKNIIENSKIGINVFDREGRYLDVNKSWINLLGYSREEALGCSYLDFTHPEDKEISQFNFQQTIKENKSGNRYTKRYLSKQGKDIWCDIVLGSIRDKNDNIEAILGLIIDITDAVEAWELLEKSQRRLELALNAANDGLWDFNIKTGETFYSSKYFEMLGYENNEFKPSDEKFFELIHPEDKERIKRKIMQFRRNEIPHYEQEFRLRTKDNQYRWILSRGKVVEEDDNGRAVRIIGTHNDITRRKEEHEKLKKSESLLLSAIEIAELAYWEYDIRKSELILNEDYIRIIHQADPEEFSELRFNPDEYIDKYVHPDDRSQLRDILSDSIQNATHGSINQFEGRFYRKDKSDGFFIGFFRVTTDRKNKPLMLYGVIQDITERKIAQKNEIEMNRIKLANQFVKTIAHEFNNPLAILRGMVELSQMPGIPCEIREDNLKKLPTAIERLHNLVEKLLELEDFNEVDYVEGIKMIDLHKKSNK